MRWTELLSQTFAFHVSAMVICGSTVDTILLNSSLLPNWPMIPMYFVSCFIRKLPTFAGSGTNFSTFGTCLIGKMERRLRTNCAGLVARFFVVSIAFSSNEHRKLIASIVRRPPSTNEMEYEDDFIRWKGRHGIGVYLPSLTIRLYPGLCKSENGKLPSWPDLVSNRAYGTYN